MQPTPDPLEKFVSDALKNLPARKAPSSLEMRVLSEIARRQALPWWKKSWSYWPPAVRWLFLVVSAALSAAMIYGCFSLFRGGSLDAAAAMAAKPLQNILALWTAAKSLADLAQQAIRWIPSPWLYGALAAIALVYGTLFGLGATAYRLLWQSR